MKQSFKIMLMSSALAVGMMAGAAQAAVVTFTLSGVIYDGYDSLGIFGAVGDLAGKSYRQSITTDTAFLPSINVSPGVNAVQSIGIPGIKFTGSVTVEGRTYTWQVDNVQKANIYLANLVTRGETNPQHAHEQVDIGITGEPNFNRQGWSMQAYNNVRSHSTPFLASIDFDQHFAIDMTRPNLRSESYFYAGDLAANRETWFTGEPGTASWSTNAVPEPQTYAMLIAGLGLLGLAVRRKLRRQRLSGTRL